MGFKLEDQENHYTSGTSVKEVRDKVGLPEERASLHPGGSQEAGKAVAGQSPCSRMGLDGWLDSKEVSLSDEDS